MEEESTPNIWDTVINRLQGKTSVYGDQEKVNQNDLKLLQLRLQDPNLTPEQRQTILSIMDKAKPKTPPPKVTIAPPAPKPKTTIATPAPKQEVAKSPFVMAPAAVATERPAQELTVTPFVDQVKGKMGAFNAAPSTAESIGSNVRSGIQKLMPDKPTYAPKTPAFTPTPLPDPTEKLGLTTGRTSPRVEGTATVPSTPPTVGVAQVKKPSPVSPTVEKNLDVDPNLPDYPEEAPSTDFGKQISKTLGLNANMPQLGAPPQAPTSIPQTPPRVASLTSLDSGIKAFTAPSASTTLESGTSTEQTDSPPQLQEALRSHLTAQEDARRNYLAAVGEYQKTGYPEDLRTRETEQKRSYDEYLRRLDSNRKAEFWDKIIGALGKITAGTVGLKGLSGIPGLPSVPAGLDVASHYSFTPAVDRKAEDTYADQLRKTQAARAEEIFKSKMEKALGGPRMQMEASAFTPPARDLAKTIQETMGGKSAETRKQGSTLGSTTTPLTPAMIHGTPRQGAATGKIEVIPGKQTSSEFINDMTAKHTGYNNLLVSSKGIPSKDKNDYVGKRTTYAPGTDPKKREYRPVKEFLSRLYDAFFAESKDHAAAVQKTDAEMLDLLNLPSTDPESKEYIDWYQKVKRWEDKLGTVSGIHSSVPDEKEQIDGGRPRLIWHYPLPKTSK